MIKQPLRYFGAKWALMPWQLQHFPIHTHYHTVFGGSASDIFQKGRSSFEFYSDTYLPVVNFFRCLQSEPIDLIQAIKDLGTIGCLCDPLANFEWGIDHAAYFYAYSNLSFSGGGTRWSSGRSTIYTELEPDSLMEASKRLQGVNIAVKSAFDAIAQIPQDPEHFIYCDPPYLQETRKSKDDRTSSPQVSTSRRQYAHELTDEQHKELAALLQGRSAVICGFPSNLYSEFFSGWTVVSKRQSSDLECLWISPEAMRRLPQLSLLAVS